MPLSKVFYMDGHEYLRVTCQFCGTFFEAPALRVAAEDERYYRWLTDEVCGDCAHTKCVHCRLHEREHVWLEGPEKCSYRCLYNATQFCNYAMVWERRWPEEEVYDQDSQEECPG